MDIASGPSRGAPREVRSSADVRRAAHPFAARLARTVAMSRCEESSRPTGRLLRSGPYKWTGLPEEPTLTMYLPPDYESSDRRYPLAIFFDGQNLFDDEGSYRGGWQLHRLLDWRACQGKRVPIAVGIDTAGWSRSAILSPWGRDGVEGLGDRTLEWIASWLVPTLRRELRVAPGPEHVVLGGSSLGGLLAIYGLARNPETFGGVLAMSPSIGLPGGHLGPIHEFVDRAPMPREGRKIYLDAGARECECTSIMHHTGLLAGLLERKGLRAHHDLRFFADPDGAHDEASWKRRLPGALDFVLG